MSSTNQNLLERIHQAEAFIMKAGEILYSLQIELTPKTEKAPATPQPTPAAPSNASPMQLANQATQDRQKRGIDDIRLSFPEEIASKLDFQLREQGKIVMIKPKVFLGPEAFRVTIDTVQSLGGTYVSAGRESHFRVPIKQDA